jgi:AraC-like DNA-binding protein
VSDLGTATVAIVRAILGGIAQAGVDASAVAAELGVAPETLADPDARVPGALVYDLCERALAVTRGPLFGLRLAIAMPAGAMAVCEYAVLERYADALLEKLPRGDPFVDNVRRAVADALRGRDPSLQATAARLGVGAGTLQRRLAALETTHQDVVEEVRNELAARYLVHEGLGVSEAAYLLGFSEPSAFHRAFKRWTGKTPLEYKKQAVRTA